jgi:hypothetical protein
MYGKEQTFLIVYITKNENLKVGLERKDPKQVFSKLNSYFS